MQALIAHKSMLKRSISTKTEFENSEMKTNTINSMILSLEMVRRGCELLART